MSDIVMDFRQPSASLADHFSFFYHFTQSNDRFETADRADFAQLRFILSGERGRCVFVDGTAQDMPDVYVQGPTTGNSIISAKAMSMSSASA